MINSSLEILWQKYATKTATKAEIEELLALLNDAKLYEDSKEVLVKLLYEATPDEYWNTEYWDGVVSNIVNRKYPQVQPVQRIHFLRRWGWAAASIVLLLSIGAYLWIGNNKSIPSVTVAQQTGNIVPGKDGAILTLADGSQVVLDSLGNGLIAAQNGSQALLRNGELVYDVTGKARAGMDYNIMRTPKGRQFTLLLPDGTKVWLNAASSIRYPTVFAGKERSVDITGEAYFEVAKNKEKPFHVNVNNKASVEVLGTNFNVNAYENEQNVNTTLIEGAIAVSLSADQQQQADNVRESTQSVMLKPGQQAQIQVRQKTRSGIKVINNADIDKVMAWKNGLFNFEGVDLKEVMRQLERWYDIEVVYEGEVPDIRFEGKMTKGITLNDLLMALERTDVNFRIDGGKLIVLP